ncbi:MAG: phosphoglycerate dehydrogenase [Gammaproteobacteria bacterium]|nr:phosphoglycerate dehydrogenase [Gammaproteobacteria bacterium]
MYRVRTFNKIAPKGIERFPDHGFEVGPAVGDPHAILLRSHKLADDELSRSLAAVARAGIGVNNVPVDLCSERGIVVFNTPGANANSVKELVLAALLLTSRDVLGGFSYVRSLEAVTDDAQLHRLVEAEKSRFKGHEVAGRTLGIVGLGAIGSRVARAALNLGMDVLGYDPALSVDAAWRLPSEVKRMENLPTLFARSDYVTLHIPALAENLGLVDADLLGNFHPNAVLLNFARQEVVDEDAVKAALADGTLAAYFADFPSTVLAGEPKAHTTPHLGASTAEAEENCAVMAADQLRQFLLYGNIDNSVNFPSVALDPAGGHRVGVTNANVAGMLGQIMSALADARINVIDMINKSREHVAYNLIDLDTKPSEALLGRIAAIDEVMSVRLFDPLEGP